VRGGQDDGGADIEIVIIALKGMSVSGVRKPIMRRWSEQKQYQPSRFRAVKTQRQPARQAWRAAQRPRSVAVRRLR